MRIVLGSDHAGFSLKQEVAGGPAGAGHEVLDVGTDSRRPWTIPTSRRPWAAP